MPRRLREFRLRQQQEAKARWDYVMFAISGVALASYAYLIGLQLP